MLSRIPIAAIAFSACASRASAQTWQDQAKKSDPTAQCAPYGYAPVTAIINTYPPVWTLASLGHPGVTDEAKALFAAISPGIPNIAPRGTNNGDWTGVKYDMAADPACWWSSGSLCNKPKLAGLPEDITRCDEGKTLGYTLDDGPNCSHNAFYDFLRDNQQKATLFYIGSNVVDWPLQAQRGLAEGHEICAHSWSHQYLTSMTNEQAFAEIYYSKKAIKDVLGVTTQCFRCPFGDNDDRIRYIINALGMRSVGWSFDTVDYSVGTAGNPAIDANYASLIQTASAAHGDAVLAHELNEGTMNLTRTWLPALKRAFTGGVMPIAVCRNQTQPYIENTATYPDYTQWTSGTRQVTIPDPVASSDPNQPINWKFKDPSANAPSGNANGNRTNTVPASGTNSNPSSSNSTQGNPVPAGGSSVTPTTSGTNSARNSTSPTPTTSDAITSRSIGALAGLLTVLVTFVIV